MSTPPRKFFCFFFYYYYYLLYNIVLVLPYINMHLPQVYMCSASWTPLPPPSPYHPSGLSQFTSPKLPISCIEPGLAIHFLYDIIHGEGNGNPLQCSCLENPRDGGAWWASVYGVTQSRTRLKRLSSSSSNSIHVLVPFSQIVPASLSHRVQKTVLYIGVSFAVLHTGLSLSSF